MGLVLGCLGLGVPTRGVMVAWGWPGGCGWRCPRTPQCQRWGSLRDAQGCRPLRLAPCSLSHLCPLGPGPCEPLDNGKVLSPQLCLGCPDQPPPCRSQDLSCLCPPQLPLPNGECCPQTGVPTVCASGSRTNVGKSGHGLAQRVAWQETAFNFLHTESQEAVQPLEL